MLVYWLNKISTFSICFRSVSFNSYHITVSYWFFPINSNTLLDFLWLFSLDVCVFSPHTKLVTPCIPLPCLFLWNNLCRISLTFFHKGYSIKLWLWLSHTWGLKLIFKASVDIHIKSQTWNLLQEDMDRK